MRWMIGIMLVLFCSACQMRAPSSPGSSSAPSASSSPNTPGPNAFGSPVVQVSPTPTAILSSLIPQPSPTPVRYAQLQRVFQFPEQNISFTDTCSDTQGNFYFFQVAGQVIYRLTPVGEYGIFAGRKEFKMRDGTLDEALFEGITHCRISPANIMYLVDRHSIIRTLDLNTARVSHFSGKSRTDKTTSEENQQRDGDAQDALFESIEDLEIDWDHQRLLVSDSNLNGTNQGEPEALLKEVSLETGKVNTLAKLGSYGTMPDGDPQYGKTYYLTTHANLDAVYLFGLQSDNIFRYFGGKVLNWHIKGPTFEPEKLQLSDVANRSLYFPQAKRILSGDFLSSILVITPEKSEPEANLRRLMLDIPAELTNRSAGTLHITHNNEIFWVSEYPVKNEQGAFMGVFSKGVYRIVFPDNKMWVSTQPAATHTEADAEVIDLLPSE